ncbi:MAG: hypothetical protein A4E45_00579 [Methanosaeta sp. PtaB.Bin039]|nr:MAG: hypothetical protein A4E45_00579 [Methanosaeta sp. PtaB.Bin039]OPY48243.1 MAG: hypothetical protein A4E47_00007 [Methanosaeta sp. PtaU1.Bin028]
MLIEVAHAVSRTKGNSKLKRFYTRIRARRGAKIAIVALARKIVCILHHLIICMEKFEDSESTKPKRTKRVGISSPTEKTIEDAMQILAKAGYIIQKEKRGG